MAPAANKSGKRDDDGRATNKLDTNGTSTQESDQEEDDEEEDEEEEPRLDYTSMTRKLTSVYQNGDATSTFLVAGDKMVSYQARKCTLRAMTELKAS